MKRTRCDYCKSKLDPIRNGQIVHIECAANWTISQSEKRSRKEAKKQRAAEKIDRALTRQRKLALKTIPQLIKEAQVEFNAFIRARDREKPCICCGRPLGIGEVGGAFDCGHYRSTGSAPHLRFQENNAHAQRKFCNRYGSGRVADYRVGLIARIGREAVEALEASSAVHKWTREELIEIRKKYKLKIKELQRD